MYFSAELGCEEPHPNYHKAAPPACLSMKCVWPSTQILFVVLGVDVRLTYNVYLLTPHTFAVGRG